MRAPARRMASRIQWQASLGVYRKAAGPATVIKVATPRSMAPNPTAVVLRLDSAVPRLAARAPRSDAGLRRAA